MDSGRVRTQGDTPVSVSSDEPQTVQLNIKLDQAVLDQLKARSDQLRYPYHRLAQQWIELALGRRRGGTRIDPSPASLPPTKDLMVLLLHATSKRGDDAVRGVTGFPQKLLFVIEQKIAAQNTRFYAYNYGPFNEEVNDAVRALRLAGFLHGAEAPSTGPPSFAEMMATAVERSDHTTKTRLKCSHSTTAGTRSQSDFAS